MNVDIVTLIAWFGFAFLTSVIVKRKRPGKSALLWFAYGLLLPFFSLIHAIAMVPKYEEGRKYSKAERLVGPSRENVFGFPSEKDEAEPGQSGFRHKEIRQDDGEKTVSHQTQANSRDPRIAQTDPMDTAQLKIKKKTDRPSDTPLAEGQPNFTGGSGLLLDIPTPTLQDVIDYATSHEFSSESIGLFEWDYIDGKLDRISSESQKFESSDLAFSPNGKYCLAYGNLNFDGKKNDVLFFSDKQHVATISAKDTLSAKVKDNGYFSLDYFGSGEIKKRTSVYDPKGVKIATLEDWFQEFDVSPNGETLAMCSEDSDSGFKPSVTFFNAKAHRKISSFRTMPGRISFDFSNNVTTVQRDGLWAKYSLDGTTLESSADMDAINLTLSSGLYWGDQIEEIRKYIKKEIVISETKAAVLARHLDTFTDKSVSALAYRAKGELAEKTGNVAAAIAHFEKAVNINPKIGVKQHLEKLKKG